MTRRSYGRWAAAGLAAVFIVSGIGFFFPRLEGDPPELRLEGGEKVLGVSQDLVLTAADPANGLRRVRLVLAAGGEEKVLLEESFPGGGIFGSPPVREVTRRVRLEPKSLKVSDGPGRLSASATDHSWRSWGSGNRVVLEREIKVDTQPPRLEVVSRSHNLNQGGAGLILYRVSESPAETGVVVGDHVFPGRPGGLPDPSIHLAFFAIPHDQGPGVRMALRAVDEAGNRTETSFHYHVNPRSFRRDTIDLPERFVADKAAELAPPEAVPGGGALDRFLHVNRRLREENYQVIARLVGDSRDRLLWEGAFLRLPAAANRAGFADQRSYRYRGKVVDHQVHLGVDLASTEQAPVPAANSGVVAFADFLGIYGNTVIIDHGHGLFTMYSHLSRMRVEAGRPVRKGEEIGRTGVTGLAGGDHLHFSVLVHDVFVNPVEWWDPRWIDHNIAGKLREAAYPPEGRG